MICYRRFIRKQLVAILLTLFIGLWFFIKSKSFTIISKNSDDEQLQSNNLPVDGKEADSEIERLSNLSLIHISSPRDKRQSRMPSSA